MPLYVLATPIGNLSELSPRAREILSAADRIAAEDTRVTRKLLQALGIAAPPVESYRGHQEARRAERFAARVADGESVVVVSDAGTPAISDPGAALVRRCHELGLPVHPVCGPSALAAALSASGLPPVPAHFLGFPPRKPGPRRRWWTAAARADGALVCFESPKRVAALAAEIAAITPDREICMCRELTKLHEEILLLPAPEMAAELAARESIRGEVVLVVGPGEPPPAEQAALRGEGMGDVAQALSRRWGVPRREVYQRLLELERTLGSGG